MQLRRAATRILFVALGALTSGRTAGAEDRVDVRGVYYREHSTRIIEPMVTVTKDLPGEFDVGAQYLLDAVTSPSVRAGAAQDEIFTENRHEVGLSLGKTFHRTRVGGAYRYSHEPDYLSQTMALSLTQGVWDNTGTVTWSGALGWDEIRPPAPFSHHQLRVYFGSLIYTQAFSPTTNVQLGYEVTFLDGYIANPYIQVPNLGHERVPEKRLRHVLPFKIAQYFPTARATLQFHYRFYIDEGADLDGPDPWRMIAHTLEARAYKELGRDFEIRLSYRFHTQGAANFWCNTDPAVGGRTDCYGPGARYFASDPKLGSLATHMPELKITWELRWFERVPVLRFFAPGAADVSYARFFQNTRYGDAHLLQTGYSLPF